MAILHLLAGEAHWEVLLRARAIETQCYVIAAAQCGQHNEKRCSYGHALIIDPWGKVPSGTYDILEPLCDTDYIIFFKIGPMKDVPTLPIFDQKARLVSRSTNTVWLVYRVDTQTA